eukprot:4917845-Pyramimonas_sp.AAC.1
MDGSDEAPAALPGNERYRTRSSAIDQSRMFKQVAAEKKYALPIKRAKRIVRCYHLTAAEAFRLTTVYAQLMESLCSRGVPCGE